LAPTPFSSPSLLLPKTRIRTAGIRMLKMSTRRLRARRLISMRR
jgi:hypothetical protein